MQNRTFRAWAIGIFALLPLSGCNLYFHDKGKSDATKTAKASFESFSKSSPNRFASMTQNLQRIATEEDALVSELAANTDMTRTTFATNGPFNLILKDLRKQCGDRDAKPPIEGELITFQNTLYKNVVKVLDLSKEHKASLNTTAETIKAAEVRVKAAKEQITRWNQTQAVLLTGIESLPAVKEESKNKTKTLSDAVADAAKAAGNKDVKYMDASDGKEKTEKLKDLVVKLGATAVDDVDQDGLGKLLTGC